MKLCAAQMQSIKGDIQKNIEKHIRLTELAVAHRAKAIFFPELSLTGYEPELADELATTQDDERLTILQTVSDANYIVIGAGLPTKSNTGICISMIIFQPHTPRQTYSKQHLHEDELPYFVNGVEQVYITIQDTTIALAICYESLLPEHAASVNKGNANIYMASVAKSANGVAKAFKHYPNIAKNYSMPVLMANGVGYCDNFTSSGSSAAWSREGMLLHQLDDSRKGILVMNMGTNEVINFYTNFVMARLDL